MATVTETVYVSPGGESVLRVLLVASSAFTASGTDYWAYTLRRVSKKPDGINRQSYGKQVATYSFATRSVSAGVPVTVSELSPAVELAAGDALVSTAVSTGSPAVPGRVAWMVEFEKKTR